MGANDVIALQANFDLWRDKRFPSGAPKDKNFNLFEYYCLDQVLRPYIIADSQLKAGMVGGSLDGGIDGLYMFVNGEPVDVETELDPKTVETVKILILQIKESEGFSLTALDKLYWFADDFLNLGKKKAEYHSTYHENLTLLMRVLKDKLGVIIGEDPPISVEFHYITKIDVEPDADCLRFKETIGKKVHEHFPKADYDFEFVNAGKLWAQIQARPPKKRTITWESQPMAIQEGIVGLVKLTDYFRFLREPDGQIAERIFDSNVRGYWPGADVNKKIAKTLKEPGPSDFWLLNNGITILAEKVEDGEQYLERQIVDPQIVNGLQTSRQIFNHFRDATGSQQSDNRRVLVRVIKTTDTNIRDEVIRCTNSQNEMPPEALRATDPIHRKIEQLFHSYDLFYDRRKGYYREKGEAVDQIVSIIDVLSAMITVVLLRPDNARARPKNYIKNDDLYASVFGKTKDGTQDKFNLSLYLKSTQIVRRVGTFLDSKNLDLIHRRNLHFYLAMQATCIAINSAYAPPHEIEKLDVAALTDSLLESCYVKLWARYEKLAEKHSEDGVRDYDKLAKGSHLLKAVLSDLKRLLHPKKKKAITP